jgi:hypothetical protein
METNKAILKFNNGNLAILCSDCSKILKTGKEFNKEELLYAIGELHYLSPQFCDECMKSRLLSTK